MNAHELRYCRYLLRCVKDLYIERAALSTMLDNSSRTASGSADWRPGMKKMAEDPVFRSSVEANFAPLFERMEAAAQDVRVFSSLPAAGLSATAPDA